MDVPDDRFPRSMLALALTHALILLLVCSCTATSPSGSSSPEPERSGGGVPADQRQALDQYWRLFLEDDPAWPEARGRWVDMGDAARSALAASLIRELIVGTSGMQVERTDRATRELVRLGAPAVPDLIETGRRGDGILRRQTAEILTLIGAPAVDPLLASLGSGRPNRFQRHQVEVLGSIGEARAFPVIARILAEGDDWAIRAAAATALEGIGDARGVARLCEGLQTETDAYVRERIILALGGFPDRAGIEALIGAMREASASGRLGGLRLLRACGRSLRRITGRKLKDDPRAWRAWWRQNRERWSGPQPRAGWEG